MSYSHLTCHAVALALWTTCAQLLAQSSSCNGYRLMTEAIVNGGGASGGGSYQLSETSGQAAVGGTGSPAISVSAGAANALRDPLPAFATYLAWKQAFFSPTQQSDPTISGPLADFDRDGDSNLLEYFAGTDPTNAESAARSFTIDATNA